MTGALNWDVKEGFSEGVTFRFRPAKGAKDGQEREGGERHRREESFCITGVRVDPSE